MLERLIRRWQRWHIRRLVRKDERSAQERVRVRNVYLTMLLDANLDPDSRTEAAWELQAYMHDDSGVEQAYVRVAVDPTSEPELAAECGENLGMIWMGNEALDVALLTQLHPAAFNALVGTMKGKNREWDLLFSDIRWEATKQKAMDQ